MAERSVAAVMALGVWLGFERGLAPVTSLGLPGQIRVQNFGLG